MGLNYAYVLAKHSFELLNQKTVKCMEDMRAGRISADVENVMFTTIAVTGVISGIARGSNQTALGHKFYETTRFLFPESARPYLHGEIVGVGLLLQNYFNGEEQNNKELLSLMKEHHMPYKITDVGITATQETLEKYYDLLCKSSAMEGATEVECMKLKESLRYLWEIK